MFQILLPASLAGQRAEVMRLLREVGIATGIHYPAIHTMSLYKERGLGERRLLHTESVAARILTLPLFPAMREADVERVAMSLRKVLATLGTNEVVA
jgi:hypothetical protein